MNIPIELFEDLKAQLPDANQFVGTCTRQEFIYQDHRYELKFYVVSDNEVASKYWLYNPFHVTQVSKNGSHRASV